MTCLNNINLKHNFPSKNFNLGPLSIIQILGSVKDVDFTMIVFFCLHFNVSIRDSKL